MLDMKYRDAPESIHKVNASYVDEHATQPDDTYMVAMPKFSTKSGFRVQPVVARVHVPSFHKPTPLTAPKSDQLTSKSQKLVCIFEERTKAIFSMLVYVLWVRILMRRFTAATGTPAALDGCIGSGWYLLQLHMIHLLTSEAGISTKRNLQEPALEKLSRWWLRFEGRGDSSSWSMVTASACPSSPNSNESK